MKFTVNKDVLVKELFKVQGIGEKRQTMLILSNILISAEANKVSLLATNLEIGTLTEFSAEVLNTGKTTVSAKNMYEICKELPTGLIEIELKDNVLKIKAGRVDFKIPTLPASDFPKVSLPSSTLNLEIESTKLKQMIDKVAFCSSGDETKYHLNSVYIDSDSDETGLRMVATDGHRLGLVDDDFCSLSKLGASKGVLLPKKGVLELRKLIETSEKINVLLESGYLYVQAANTLLFLKEMDLEYPDYMRVVPKEGEKFFMVKRQDLLSALKRVSLVATVKSKTALMVLSEGSLNLSSRSPDFGEAMEEVEVDYKNDSVEIRFNSKYLIDVLSALDDDILKFYVGDSLSPVLIRPQTDGARYMYVVMPMRI